MNITTIRIAKTALAVTAGAVSTWARNIWPMVALVVIFIVLDYATGMLAAIHEGKLSSRNGWKGIIKKTALLLLLSLGFMLDWFIPLFVAHGLHFNIPFNMPVGLIMAAWIIINESISIIENLYRCGVPAPKWFVKVLHIARKDVDKAEEEKKDDQK